MIKTKNKIYLFVPYQSFGNTCEYIHAGLCAASSNNIRLEVIFPSIAGFWYVKSFNEKLSMMPHSLLDNITYFGRLLGLAFFLFEAVRNLTNRLLKKVGMTIPFPLQYTARIFDEINWSGLDRSESYISLKAKQKRNRTRFILLHFKESDFFDVRAVKSHEYIRLAEFINNLGIDVIFLGIEDSRIHEFCIGSRNSIINSDNPKFAEETLTAIAHAEAVICCSSGPHYAALLFGKPTLALNSTQIIMEPHKQNDLTLLKQFYREGVRLTFDEYCRDLGKMQCVDKNWKGLETTQDNSIDEMISAFCVFARMNQINMNFASSKEYIGRTQNLKNMISDALVGGKFDHIYGKKRQDGAKYWRERLKFNSAVDQKFYWIMRW